MSTVRLFCPDDSYERRPVVRRRLHDDPDGRRERGDGDERGGGLRTQSDHAPGNGRANACARDDEIQWRF